MKQPSPVAPFELADHFHALSDQTRVSILELLQGGEHCVCELTEALELTQPLLSFHLKVLKEAGFVRDWREGRWAYYALDPDSLVRMGAFLRGLTAPVRRKASARCQE